MTSPNGLDEGRIDKNGNQIQRKRRVSLLYSNCIETNKKQTNERKLI
jgi:hypothetical protein